MRASLARLAAAAPVPGSALRPSQLALLPPISLYRRLFRAHRKHLPAEMRVLGDEYIKAEFRAHRKIDNPAHLVKSLAENRTRPFKETVVHETLNPYGRD